MEYSLNNYKDMNIKYLLSHFKGQYYFFKEYLKIMRISLFFLFACTLSIFAENSEGQNAVITMDRNTLTIGQLVKEIENKTSYLVVYSNHEINTNQTVSLKDKRDKVCNLLKAAFEKTNIRYKFKDNYILLSTNNNISSLLNEQQQKNITGTVCDSKGEPIIGASVTLAGNKTGTITDVNGRFNIAVPQGSTLVISSIGYISQQVAARDKMRIILKEDIKKLDEIVVIGYNTIKKKDLTTAVSVVSTADISERPIISAEQAIEGKAAGVQVTQTSGQPGSEISIRVRGATSIEASNEPLYVVDGMPTTTISNLNPIDIESLQILKDASSAAIYGARAANGVVLITTKRGKAGVRSIAFDSYLGFSKLGKKINALNTEQYKDYIKDLNKYSSVQYNIPDDEHRYTNWSDEFYGTGFDQNYQISLSNGNDKLKYFVSGGYVKEKGIVEKANRERYNFRTNIDNQQTNWLKMGINISYSYIKGREVEENKSSLRAGSIMSVINTPPYMQVWDSNNPSEYDEFAYGSRILSPEAANAADQTYNRNRLVGSAYLDFTLFKKIHYKVSFGIDENHSRSLYYLDPESNSDGRSTHGRVEEGNGKDFEWLWENLLSYDNKIGQHHNISLLGGATMQHAKSEGGNLAGYDLLDSYPNIRSFSACNIIDKDATYSYASEWSLASFLGRVAYDYDSKYLVSANFRVDGSSKFAPGHRWGFFPSISAGWRLSSEPFMEWSKNFISDMKIRAGWGLNGNQEGIGNYSWKAQYAASKNVPTTDTPLPGLSLTRTTPGNKELTWEKTTQTNIGMDLSMFDSRLVFTFDWYYKHTKDMLLTVYLPSTANIPAGITRNDAEMTNKGFEISIQSTNFDTKQFKWDTNFNVSFNKNKVNKLGLNKIYYYASTYTTAEPAIILKEGVSLGTFFGYRSEGVDPETGDIIYKDLNDNGIIDPGDRTTLGNAQPICIFGLTNNFTYKRFNLSLFFQGSYGNKIFNESMIDMTDMLDFRNQSTAVLRRWKRPGMITNIPRPGIIANDHNSSRFVENGSYLRLKSMTLSYDFDTKSGLLYKAGIKRLRPYVTGQNLWTWTKYKGYDPEVNAYGASAVELGVDYGTYPQSKALIFGLNVEF